jgi:protein TonB
MKRHFGLPAAFALTLLAFLLFGFTKTSRSKPLPPEKLIVIDDDFLPPVPPEPVEELDRTASSSSSTSVPMLAELIKPVEQGTFTFEPPALSPVETRALPNLIPFDPHGFSPGDGAPGVNLPGPVDASRLDNPPRASVQTPPAYPPVARAMGLGGEVWVEFAVDEAGRVLRARVVRSSDPMFDEPTLRAVAKWRFEPGRKNGRPVSFRMVAPVSYRLSD